MTWRLAILTIAAALLGGCRIPLVVTDAEVRPLSEAEAREVGAVMNGDGGDHVTLVGRTDRPTLRMIAYWRLDVWLTVENCAAGGELAVIPPAIERLDLDDFDGMARLLAARPIRETFEVRVLVPRDIFRPGQCVAFDAHDKWLVWPERRPVPIRYAL